MKKTCANCHRDLHTKKNAFVAQLDNASDYESEDCRFEPCRVY